jgi:hypothetical protein
MDPMGDTSPAQPAGSTTDLRDLDERFHEHDERALADLSAEDLATQVKAREQVWLHIDAIWHRANAQGLNPSVAPEWTAVSGLRDLASSLYQRALTVATAGGED